MRKVRFSAVPALLAALALAPVATLARAAHGDIAGLGDGILHVTSGLDHMLAAVAIGVWSMAYPWRRAWLLPAAFVGAMAAAAWVGIGHAKFDAAEMMIVASLIVLGVLIMRAKAFSVAGAVVAEFVGSDKGLGYIILAATSYWKADLAFGAMFLLSLTAILLFSLVSIVERLICPWYAKGRH